MIEWGRPNIVNILFELWANNGGILASSEKLQLCLSVHTFGWDNKDSQKVFFFF